ncbi:MAG TPA: hypothetical protein VKE69_02770 [Planctomycetota bacterium]|nr:hypothetical protein [Planctomycetota bacterium]
MKTPSIRLRGARENNLRGVDLDLPVGRRIALTGVSGSGKSSLAFDTLAREGLRRFLETLALSAPAAASVHARRLGAMPRPAFDSLAGLPAVIAVGQGDLAAGARTTLGTLTGITPALRVLLARYGESRCPTCGRPRPTLTSAQLVASLAAGRAGRSLRILAPVTAAELDSLPARGVVRALVAGEELRLDEADGLSAPARGPVYAIVDRLVLRDAQRGRLGEAVERALEIGRGRLAVEEGGDIELHATSRGCPHCGIELPTPSPRLLSRSSAPGACAECKGLGCATCGESGLSPLARSIRLDGRSLADLEAVAVSELRRWMDDLELPATVAARELRAEIALRCASLVEVGLGSLQLRRGARTLSTGEGRRARLAGALGARVSGALVVLDEPTIGCHPFDRAGLLSRIDALRDRGNTVLVVEHDLEVIRTSDLVVELGPGGGRDGGRVVSVGAHDPSARRAAPRRVARARPQEWTKAIRVVGARGHNLRGVDAGFALGALTAVCGVSGSGKSSLVFGTLGAAARRDAEVRRDADALPCARIEGLDLVERVIEVGPRLPARSARSSPATYLGVAAVLRELYAATPDARARGFSAARFGSNRKGDAPADSGRCEACAGLGSRTIELDFVETVTVPCEVCGGTRFSAATLEIRWKGRSLAETLALTLEEAARELGAIPKIARALAPAVALGLGYLRLGERSDALSGGELQRLQVARELATAASSRPALVLLDEPTRGLHARETRKLVDALRELAARGHAVVVVEHHLDLIAAADRVVELGPGAGEAGGRVVFEGTPDALARAETATGRALRGDVPHPSRRRWAAGARASAIVARGASIGARRVDAEIPRGVFAAITGPSGSGKTALAFDVIAAEGRRRFLSALAVAERRALERVEAPDADAVDGVGATVALRDLPPGIPWGEATGLLPRLRSLFARFAAPHCPTCGEPCISREPAEAVDLALASLAGRRAIVVAPRTAADGATWDAVARELRREGYARVRVDGEERRLETLHGAAPARFDLVIDRVVVGPASRARLLEAAEDAAAAGGGRGSVVPVEEGETVAFDREGRCPRCGWKPAGALRPSDFEAPTLPSARLAGRAWPADDRGWTLARIDELVRAAKVPAATPALSALEEAARWASAVVDRDAPLAALRADGLDRAAWIAVGAGTSPAGATVVVDDPTRGLDEAHARRLVDALDRAADGTRTIVVASSDPQVAAKAAAHVDLGPRATGASRVSFGDLRVVAQTPPAAERKRIAATRDLVTVGLEAGAPAVAAEALGILAPLAALYARTPEARAEGFGPERFDYRSPKSGRCEACRGRGVVEIDLDYLPGERVACSACAGARYEPRTLAVRLYGRTIAETLALTLDEARGALADHPALVHPLETACALGLGGLPLGAARAGVAPSVSARLELAAALGSPAGRRPASTALVVARATDGLFGADLERVIRVLRDWANAGGEAVLVDARRARATVRPRVVR